MDQEKKPTSDADWLELAPPEVRAHLSVTEVTVPLNESDNFGLHFPLHYAWQTWRQYKEYGHLPRAGGYDDQYTAWLEDVAALDHRYHGHWKTAKALWDEQHR